MKKLMIAAAIVCAAVVSQGASFYWGIDNSTAMGPAGDSYSDPDGYLLDGIAKLYIDEVLVATASMDMDSYKFGSLETLASDSTGKVQALDAGDISKSFVGQAYKIVLETTDGAYSWETTGISKFASEAAGAGEPNNNFEKFITFDAPASAGDWKAVPEPTSGLLLLIGVAGLALRRRRA